ncbi:MAG: bifunctional (p)ppGpp synthetase/guanosine-3',5'-bis(diphosphate) 3'-pyrophosphohydrolase [Bacteroidales bacterium]|nr:bifunctional (p)ppGpp synthetase/guanosine-3',5'-bis(diphosphate) 3'-pyrophosphohydrolase [Bacteroidales bacterium]
MSDKTDEQLVENQIVEQEFNALLDDYLSSNHRRKVELITRAFNFANQAHKGAKRRSGEPYIMHPLAVARVVSKEMGLGSTSICSALLHDVVEDTEYTVEDIKSLFGEKIATIVDGLTKISGGVFGEQASAQAENFRKLLLTMSEDIRVILIKIADRLHNMRTLDSMLPAKQLKIAGETLYIYAPMAHRLGLFSIKSELEDLSFKYEHPDEYKQICDKLNATAYLRNTLYENFSAPLLPKLNELGIPYEMKERVKSVYSIWNKMQVKNIPFEEIYDIFAVRIIFDYKPGMDEKKVCWDIYSVVTDLYRIRPDRIRDWVSRPKANGYQALHVTVMGPDGQWIEVQIRSSRMDDIAEKGFAAHWKYKEGNIEEDTELDKWLETIQEILENPSPNALDFLDTIKMNLFSAEIFVFTPKGDLKTLPQEATIVDFAYSLHTNIGNQCIGAKVNHRLVPLSYKLQSGDQVEVLTSRSQKPKEEWLSFVTTARARTKIELALKKQRKDYIKQGEKLLTEAMEKEGLNDVPGFFDQLIAHFGFAHADEFYCLLGRGDFTLPESLKRFSKDKSDFSIVRYVKRALNAVTNSKSEAKEPEALPEKSEEIILDKKKPYILKCEGNKRNYVIAKCCNPIPGDEVLGFVDNNEVTVHKRSCPIAMRLKSSFGERIITTKWAAHSTTSFPATIEIKGIDRVGVLNEISQVISQKSVNIRMLHIDTLDGIFTGQVEILVHDVDEIATLRNGISKIKSVKSVKRIDR